jgi:UDP-GlcNAc:undecaprenyl-phosphate/decaprenyl-phosphate GlcNAc-1-phosphate transferase
VPSEQTRIIDVVGAYWPVLVCAFAVSFVATPACRWVALRWKIVDRPDDFLKPHAAPTAYLGGVAIFLGWCCGIGVAWMMFNATDRSAESPSLVLGPLLGVFIAGLLSMLLGLFDDLRMASSRFKLLGLCVVVVVLVVSGIGDDTVRSWMGLTSSGANDLPPWLVLAYSLPITFLIVLGACNATNLIDGMDSLCTGVVAITSAGLLVLAIHCHLGSDRRSWDVLRLVVTLSMMGGALGFLPFNRHPAKIFMGDAGSMLLGLNVAVVLLIFAEANALRYLLASIMVFGLPIADTALAMTRRWRNGKPITQGDRSHYYDQLIDRGWSVDRVVVVSYAACAIFASLGCLAIVVRLRYLVPIYAIVVVGVAVLVSRLGMVDLESREE